MLSENEIVRYAVVCKDSVLLNTESKQVAEHFISTLETNTQERATIVPITKDGLQVLME